MRIAAFVNDLWDRSRIEAALPETKFVSALDPTVPADVVIIDLTAYGNALATIRTQYAGARIVAYGPHVILGDFPTGDSENVDVVAPRAKFFRDPRFVITNG